jgi:hypothetical protein
MNNIKHIQDTIDPALDLLGMPPKIWVCHCKHCSFAKNTRRNRKFKKKIKRLLNKKRRTTFDCVFTFYWA